MAASAARSIGLGVALLRAIGFALAILSVGSPRETMTALDDAIGVLTMLGFVLLSMVAILLLFLMVMGFVSTIVCRLHDRGKSGWWIVLYCVAAHRLATDASHWHGDALIIPLAAAAVLTWGLIELGFLPGRPAEPTAEPA